MRQLHYNIVCSSTSSSPHHHTQDMKATVGGVDRGGLSLGGFKIGGGGKKAKKTAGGGDSRNPKQVCARWVRFGAARVRGGVQSRVYL